jgi:hypothetical protein
VENLVLCGGFVLAIRHSFDSPEDVDGIKESSRRQASHRF